MMGIHLGTIEYRRAISGARAGGAAEVPSLIVCRKSSQG